MTGTPRRSPSWGAFKELTPRANVSARPEEPEVEATALASVKDQYSQRAPAFDVRDPVPAEDHSFYAVDTEERNEEEYDELGEGAIRQIGRSFVSLVSVASAAALAAAVVMWSIPTGDNHMVAAQQSLQEPDAEVVLASHDIESIEEPDFFIGEGSSSFNADADEVVQFIEIDVELPVPSVIAKAEAGSSPLKSTMADTSGYSGPVPMPRDVAFLAMAAFEESPLAQGSDDEALTASVAHHAPKSRQWVSVMIPKTRPNF